MFFFVDLNYESPNVFLNPFLVNIDLFSFNGTVH